RRLLDLRRGLAIALGSVAAAVAMVVLGAPTDSGVAPPVDRFVVEHAATTGQLPLDDPAAGIVVSTVYAR
ncbi:MAG: hypothetical protein ABR520_03300, partial [Mycobacteriales bacterium]